MTITTHWLTCVQHNEFNPNRFANNQAHFPKYVPFSSGPRNCTYTSSLSVYTSCHCWQQCQVSAKHSQRLKCAQYWAGWSSTLNGDSTRPRQWCPSSRSLRNQSKAVNTLWFYLGTNLGCRHGLYVYLTKRQQWIKRDKNDFNYFSTRR